MNIKQAIFEIDDIQFVDNDHHEGMEAQRAVEEIVIKLATAMQARIEKLAEYPERLQKAITELEALNPSTFMEGSRIDGKIQGVKLALGYFEEMTR